MLFSLPWLNFLRSYILKVTSLVQYHFLILMHLPNDGKGILLLSFYSLGLAIPFILSGYGIARFLEVSKNLKKNMNLISITGGIILLATGILILTDKLQTLGFYILEVAPFLGNFG